MKLKVKEATWTASLKDNLKWKSNASLGNAKQTSKCSVAI